MYKEKIIQMLKSPALADIWTWSQKSHWAVFWICILNLIVSGGSLVITVATRGLIDGATAHISSQLYRCGNDPDLNGLEACGRFDCRRDIWLIPARSVQKSDEKKT